MRSLVSFAAMALAAGVLVPQYLSQHRQNAAVAPAMIAARSDATPASNPDNTRSLVLSPDSRGHFRVGGRIDARPLDFVIDTGASMIALTARDAATLGIHPAFNDYTITAQTANGTVHAAPVTLDRVEIGGIAIRDVAAIVMPEGALSDNLLGMTFLSRLHRYEYSGGRMVLEQ
ncbi:MAG TPA: TIGR02281 family clan AA aspartic protease [Xanthobacteraceae bacterium]|nr:TIGR02281 family clan AA aspartic protease [Xanthobacteraceae bacterium]